MTFPLWNPSFTVKVKRCDEDHQKLFSLIQQLHDAIAAGEGSAIARDVIQELCEYTRTHFAAEEELLERTKYPALPHHRLQHRTFVSKLEELQEALRLAPATTPIALVEYLKNWLVRHIKMVDRLYSEHLNANGIE